jgi:hypothetical protein
VRNKALILVIGLVPFLISTPVPADNLEGAGVILCTAVEATRCDVEHDCQTKAPWALNVPQFVIVDLEEKSIRTTEASGENRATPITTLVRKEGLIYLQGIEGGRAFSFVIDEATGKLSVAVALRGMTSSVFGACTPYPEEK